MNGTSVEQHFVDVASKYPLIVFERQMTHYIARSQKLLVDPKLSRVSTTSTLFLSWFTLVVVLGHNTHSRLTMTS